MIILKIGLFRRVKELSKSNITRYGLSHLYLESKIERIFAIACLGKKIRFSYGNLRISRLENFKNRSFSRGQGLAQIEPNSVWDLSTPWLPRV